MTDQYLWNMDYDMTRLLHEMIINMVDDLAYTSDVLGKQKIDSAIIRQFAEEDLLDFRNWAIFYLGNRIGANYPSVNSWTVYSRGAVNMCPQVQPSTVI